MTISVTIIMGDTFGVVSTHSHISGLHIWLCGTGCDWICSSQVTGSLEFPQSCCCVWWWDLWALWKQQRTFILSVSRHKMKTWRNIVHSKQEVEVLGGLSSVSLHESTGVKAPETHWGRILVQSVKPPKGRNVIRIKIILCKWDAFKHLNQLVD